ncbi:type IV pilus assembly protein PilM [Demequina sp. NBRC 110053]|uniref:type IV pilus assembly protein PilM n=1 Tax=Demequina sp. NBRC 110053 TaxID=1570342 RepID=UPI0009FDC3C4|nr:type IV pilus assembly protein PilM [Demequina sp. NBRC 110053]
MAKKQAIGLDIGAKALRAAEVVTAGGGRSELVRYAEVPIPAGAVKDGEVVDQAEVAQAIKALWSRGGFSSKDVILGIGNQRVTVRTMQLPKMPMSDIRSSLPFQVEDSLPIPVDEAVLDFYPTVEFEGPSGSVYEGLVVAAARETVMSNVNAAEAAGLKPLSVDLSAFALLRAMARGELGHGTVALVDIGARITTIVVATDGAPRFVRTLPVGTQGLADILARAKTVSQAEAEHQVITRGLQASSAPENQISADQYNDAARNLVEGIRNSIGFYQSNNRQAPVAYVVLTGGGSTVPGLGQAIASETRTQTLLGNPLEGVAISKRIQGLEGIKGREATMAMSMGLGMGVAA